MKSLNLREELPELITSTDAINADHTGCCKSELVDIILMLINHIDEPPEQDVSEYLWETNLTITPYLVVQSQLQCCTKPQSIQP